MTEKRAQFATRLGVIATTVGSAVGLGNIWRFPYEAGVHGGGAFLLIDLFFVFVVGIPVVCAEFIIGRHTGLNVRGAFKALAPKRAWGVVGYMGLLSSILILSFYSVVAGWTMKYIALSLSDFDGINTVEGLHGQFDRFASSDWSPLVCTLLFLLANYLILARGVQKGIERMSNIMMPLLFVILAVFCVNSLMMPGAADGLKFLFSPDFSQVTPSVMIEAMGQAFFSLSLGTACLCTYASYFGRKTNLAGAAVQIALIDTLIAILAGLMIFPAAFSVGVHPDSGPSLIFITLPNVFRQAFLGVPFIGYVVSVLFYALMSLAALTSTISMHEIGTAFFHEELKLSRRGGAAIVTVLCCIMTVLCSLSFGACPELAVAGKSLMDCFDNVTAQVLMPLAAFLTCLFVGWYIPRTVVADELSSYGAVNAWYTGLYLYSVKIICPLGILAIFLHQFGLI